MTDPDPNAPAKASDAVSDSPRSRVPSFIARARTINVVVSAIALVALLVVLAVHLGPALIGLKTFSAVDRLSAVYPWWSGGERPSVLNPFLGDSIDALLPNYIQMREGVLAGSWPLWSSIGGPGAELLASTNTPALTLSTFWFLVVPTILAPALVKLTEVILAMAGMYLWMRRVGVGTPAALVAGVIYCGSGFFVGWATWTAQSSVAAMLPAIFWAVEFVLARRTIRSALPLAFTVALLLLGGFPAAAGHALYAAGLYFLTRYLLECASMGPGTRVRVFASTAGAVALGFALSSVQLIPFALGLQDVDLSVRDRQFFAQQPIRSLLSVFFPETFYEVGYGGGTNPIEAYAFLGIGAVFFAALAVILPRFARQKRGVVPFLVAIGMLAASIVWFQGWWPAWLANLPVLSGNNSGRLRDIVMLAGAALAGIGLHHVVVARREQARRILIAAAVAASLASVLVIVVWWRYPVRPTTVLVDALPGIGIIVAAVAAVIFARRYVGRLVALGAIAVLVAVQMSTSVSNYWPLSDRDDFYPETALTESVAAVAADHRIATSSSFMGSTSTAYGVRSLTAHTFQPESWKSYLLALDLGAFGAGQSPTNPTLRFPGEETGAQRSLLDRLSVSAWVTSPGEIIPGVTATLDGRATSDGQGGSIRVIAPGDPVVVPLDTEAIRGVNISIATLSAEADDEVTVSVDVLDSEGRILASGALTRDLFNPQAISVAVAAEQLVIPEGASLRISTSSPVSVDADADGAPVLSVILPSEDGLSLVYADDHGTVWQRLTALPRVRWAGLAESYPASGERLQRLGDQELSSSTVILDGPGPEISGSTASVDVVLDEGDRLVADVDADGLGYLVVADWMHRGWAVKIDGEPAEIVEADEAASAVLVPRGSHRVEFTYVGAGVAVGSAVSLTALGLVAIILAVGAVIDRSGRSRDRRQLRFSSQV